ncbi:antitoxin [Saccharothrix hoggarensis]|uniref:Antitoxin n=1 Tax=Saccharothrix hoggarensis TaxID=913853 RepID=A0ABW3QPK8_9PSEU
MGIGDKFDGLKDKAKEALGQHGDKADQGVDKAGEFLDERTGGRHSEHIQTGTEKAKEGLDRFGGQQPDQQQ